MTTVYKGLMLALPLAKDFLNGETRVYLKKYLVGAIVNSVNKTVSFNK